MDTTRWERIQALFHEAVELPSCEHEAFLSAACHHDQVLMQEVLALLEEDAKGSSLLDGNVAQVARQVLSESIPPALASKQFGPYRIKKTLGEGGMGVVYLAEREDLGSQVAIKVLRDAWLSPARRERFASEQRTLAQLNHPSIARLYDADMLADGTPCFIMEYVEGLPLTEYCTLHECSVEQRLQLFRAVCEAVQYAHQHAVIHRDLKPSNILVKPDGTVRLLDFGIAKQLDSPDAAVDQTRTGLRMMTPAYAAPEQIRGDRIGIHTDVYSLGVILYELLAEQLPFDLTNLTPVEAATIIVEHEPGRPSGVARRVRIRDGAEHHGTLSKAAWADLDVLCLTAMHKDPRRRYRSVEALVRDIDHYLKREPLEARADTMHYRLGKFVRRNWRAVSTTAAVLVLITGLVVFFTLRLAGARDAAVAEAARTQRIQHFMTNLFEGGDEAAGPADDMRVITLVERGVQEARALNTDPKVQAELFYNFGGIYEQLGKLDQADSLFQSALEQRKKLFGQESPEVAETLVALGGLRSDQAQYEEAKKLIREGLEMDQRLLPPNHPAIGKAMSVLGAVMEANGEYEPAIKMLDQAMQIQSAGGRESADLAVSLTELANSHYYLGHLDVSESLNQRVLELDRQLYGDRHPNVGQDLINLGAVQFERGNYTATEKNYRQALEIIQTFYGKNHPETASAMTLLGRVLVNESRWNEAAVVLKDALAVQERVYPDKIHPRIASTLNELGKIAQQQGKYGEAEADFRRMAEVYRAVYKGKHQHIGVALSNLGGVYMEEKQYARAEKFFREALEMYSSTLPSDHVNVGVTRARLGRVLVRERRYVDAEAESRAGYEILLKQDNPSLSWLENARKDLMEEYAALKQPEKAAKIQAELAAVTTRASK